MKFYSMTILILRRVFIDGDVDGDLVIDDDISQTLLSFLNTNVYSFHSAIMMILNVISPLIFSYEGNATDDAKTMIIFINFNFLVVKMILATHQGSRRESGRGEVW